MDTQSNDFKKRLAEKKKRYRLSTSDVAGSNDVGRAFKNMGIISIDNKSNNFYNLVDERSKTDIYEIIKRIPFVRWCVLGIKKEKKHEQTV